MPLPEVLVAEFKMALTAFWRAEVSPVFVLEEEFPRSWLSDSLLELAKLDKIELIPLVLIPTPPANLDSDRLGRLMAYHSCYRQVGVFPLVLARISHRAGTLLGGCRKGGASQAAEKRWFFAFRFSGELIAGRFGLIRRDLRG
ncbi:MAG: hypothetical protein ABSF14_13055, partial [Terriglobia bacterium]